MNSIHPSQRVTVSLETADLDRASAIPSLKDFVKVDPKNSRLNVDLNRAGPVELPRLLEQHGIRVSWYSMTTLYGAVETREEFMLRPSPSYWDYIPEDCAGATLASDGYVATNHRASFATIVPPSEPFYTIGRPAFDAEHERGTIHVISTSGLLLINGGLLRWLKSVGAEGETAPVIYRGANKAAYDTVQTGLKRFYPSPCYEVPIQLHGYCDIDLLPSAVSEDFTCCGLITNMVDFRGFRHREYEMVINKLLIPELQKYYPKVLLQPVFRSGGNTHQWVTTFDLAMHRLGAALPEIVPQ